MPVSPAKTRAAWARVQILLNLGRMDEALAGAVSALAITRFKAPPVGGGPQIFPIPHIPAGWCLFTGDPMFAVINTDVADEFALSLCMREFAQGIHDSGARGPLLRRYDIESWRLLDELS